MSGNRSREKQRKKDTFSALRYAREVFLLFLIFMLTSCTGQPPDETASDDQIVTGAYPDPSEPSIVPRIFAPGIISTGFNERDITFSPDGDEIFFTLQGPRYTIITMRRDGDVWQPPEVAVFSGTYNDVEPFVTPDGSKLFFASDRPSEGKGPSRDDYDIWYVEKRGTGWSEPINPGEPLNTAGNEFYPSASRHGNLYFTAAREEEDGSENIYVSKLVDGTFTSAQKLGPGVNTEHGEFNALISPDEDFLIFSSFGRDDGQGGGDLYISFRREDGSWSTAVNMGTPVNSPSLDFCPAITPDGDYLFFTSSRTRSEPDGENRFTYEELVALLDGPGNGSRDIYWVSSSIIGGYR